MTSLIPDSYKYSKLIGIPRNHIGHKGFSGFEISYLQDIQELFAGSFETSE